MSKQPNQSSKTPEQEPRNLPSVPNLSEEDVSPNSALESQNIYEDDYLDDGFTYVEDDEELYDQGLSTLVDDPVNDFNKYYDVNRYSAAQRKKSGKKSVVIAVIAILLLLAGGIALAITIYVSGINSKLNDKVTDELREQLVKTEAGDPFYLLLLGVDKDQGRLEDTENYGTDEHAYRSDSIMLCRIDPKNVKVTMVSIHRDTLINMDEHGRQKINNAYSFGGAAYATQTVSKFAGVPISHYAEVDLDRFISIVDQVGGVTVNLPVPVHDPEYTELDLPAGEQTLDGEQAALLCRCRHGYDAYGDGDVFRAANQRMVISAVVKKVLASDPATIASTISTMADSVTTDMDVSSILDLAMQMKAIDVENDILTGMEPTDGALVNDTWYEICLVDKWREMMMRVDKGLPPYDEQNAEQDSTKGIAGTIGDDAAAAAAASAAAAAASAQPETPPAEGEQEQTEQEPAADAAPQEENNPAPAESYTETNDGYYGDYYGYDYGYYY